MKKAVIFDLDGTLLNTLESIAYCGNLTLKHFRLQTVSTEKFPQFVGHGAEVLIKGIFEYVHADSKLFEDFRHFYLDTYNKNGLYNTAPYNGIPELLNTLHGRGIKTAVLSNKPHEIVKNACNVFFKNIFDAVYGQRDNVPAKPDPYMINKLINEFGIKQNECIYCGDSGVDIETGKNANVLTLGASWGFYGDTQFKNADGILKKPHDMMKYI